MKDTKQKCVVDTLEREILAGRYGQDQPLPSERALIRRFGFSRITVQRALGELARRGLVVRRQGSGTYATRFGSARKIGLLLSGMTYSEYFQPVATAFMKIARETGYLLSFNAVRSPDPDERIHEAREIVADFIRERVAGVIYHPLDYAYDGGTANRRILSALRKAKIPVVLFDSDIEVLPARSDYDVVSIDNVAAGERVARHLIDAGAKNVCFLLKPNWMPNAQNRIRGVMCAVAAAGLRWTSSNVLIAAADDLTAIRRQLRRRPCPDAFVCENDNIAAEFLQSLKKLGVAVPQKVLLAGFDDVNIARLLSPPLTSIHQPCEQLASAAFRRLVARIVRPSLPPQEIFIHAPLSTRASTFIQTTDTERKKTR